MGGDRLDQTHAGGQAVRLQLDENGFTRMTTGLVHALVAMDLPGPGTVFMSQNWKFTGPVYIGDTITAEVEVLKVHTKKPVT